MVAQSSVEEGTADVSSTSKPDSQNRKQLFGLLRSIAARIQDHLLPLTFTTPDLPHLMHNLA